MVLRAEMLDSRAPKLYDMTFFRGRSDWAVHVRFSLRAWALVTSYAEATNTQISAPSRGHDVMTLVVPLGPGGDALRTLVVVVHALTFVESLEVWAGEPGSQLVWIDGLLLRGTCGMAVVLTPEMTAFVREAPQDVFTRLNEHFHAVAPRIAGDLSPVYGVFREHGALRLALGGNCACLGTNHMERSDFVLKLHGHNIFAPHVRLALATFAALEDEYRAAHR